jgi:RimJ/RimL family protein N-acetyltransferase
LREDEPIGTIFDYGLKKAEGYTFFAIFLIREVESKGYGTEAVVLFLHYLFINYNLYKVYAEVYEYNTKTLGMLKKGGFVEEGRFRGHRVYEGKRYSLLQLAYFREQLPELEAFLNKKCRIKVE